VVPEAFLAQLGMATREELARGGIDPAAFVRYAKDWYDGSIRGMDTELARLIERLAALGLRERSLIAFYADHGEEFHDHGRMFHGQSVYGEMIDVPLIVWAPGHIPQGLKVEEPVQLIDLMPTLLDLSQLRAPAEVQGQSLRPLLAVPATASPGASPAVPSGWNRRPLFAEKNPSDNSTDFPSAAQSYAVVDGQWKLIHNVVRPPEKPEFELYDFYQDGLDQKNVAGEHPDQVERLAKVLAGWRQWAQAARLKPDSDATKGMTAEQLEQLRSLGYIK
jgi:arylsulfatase A-like enzyme